MASAFEEVLSKLALPRNPRILDVGAGGFLGETTTKFLLKIPGAQVDAVEIVPERAEGLVAKFGKRLTVRQGDFLELAFPDRYDLVSLDLDSQIIPALFEDWIPGKVASILQPKGAVLTLSFGFGPKEPTPKWQLADEMREIARDFLLRFFGVDALNDAAVAARYERDPQFRFVAMRGKQKSPPPETIVWIGLQRR